MIRIIKNGIIPKKYKYIYSHTCSICTCEFEFEESDCTKVRHEKHIDGEYRGEINCPYCGERLFIDFTTTKYREEEIIEEPINLHIGVMDEENPKVYDPWNNEHCNGCLSKNQIGDACSFCAHSPYSITCNEVEK